MTLTLYMNNSPSNFVNKSLAIIDNVSGVLREPTSIIEPTILLERASPTGFNYAYIPEFSRYYYVTGISSEVNGLIVIAMHVDVLMTYKAQIAAADAIVKRQEYRFNLYLDDGIFKVYQPTKHKTIPFPYGFGNNNDYSFVLALAGNSPP